MKIGVVGAGSIGIVVGGLIAKAGVDIDLIDTYDENVKALKANGAKILGCISCTVPVKAMMLSEVSETYDLIFLTVKQVSNQEVLTKMLPYLAKDAIVCTLQNGIPEESVGESVGIERVVGGATGFGATWLEPGVSQITSHLETMEHHAFEIGELDGKITPRIKKVQEILNHVGKCNILEDFIGVRWSKLLMNATFSGMSAALGCTMGDVLHNEKALECVSHIADETVKVAHLHNVKLVEMQGINFEDLELLEGQTLADKKHLYHTVWDQHVNLKASMLQDLYKGRPTEIDYINGFVCKKGREAGFKTPFNDMVVTIVKEEGKTGRINTIEDVKRFDSLLAQVR